MPNHSLYRYDPISGIAIAERNPEKTCQYSACPKRSMGYAGKKMKQYKAIFTWAATEALRIHTTDDILYNVLKLILTYSDRIPASRGPIPSPFYILSCQVIPLDGDMITSLLATSTDRVESRVIRAIGGAGRAIVAFQFIENPLDPRGANYMKSLKIDLKDPLIPGYKHFDGWRSVLTGVVNGTISALDIGRSIGYQSSNANTEVHEEVHADGKDEEEAALLDRLKNVSMSD
ncbi:hypothetical protein C8R42DRAFT_729016 [Lentinula raphanica]|nr:hypothetical protein C8R42DRAFT_729016 [Lentinula raphanica]